MLRAVTEARYGYRLCDHNPFPTVLTAITLEQPLASYGYTSGNPNAPIFGGNTVAQNGGNPARRAKHLNPLSEPAQLDCLGDAIRSGPQLAQGRRYICCLKSSAGLRILPRCEIFLTVRLRMRCGAGGAMRTTAMIETVTAIFGLLSASIFLAHALEGYRSRPSSVRLPRRFRNI
jgi:hypothetical protein